MSRAGRRRTARVAALPPACACAARPPASRSARAAGRSLSSPQSSFLSNARSAKRRSERADGLRQREDWHPDRGAVRLPLPIGGEEDDGAPATAPAQRRAAQHGGRIAEARVDERGLEELL